mgnify:CR=1 FL=1
MPQNPQQSKQRVLVLSDHPPLNRAHAEFLRLHGYEPLTAITYTDAVRLMEKMPDEQSIYAIVVASKVHGWHHLEGEEQPEELEADETSWQLDNIREVYDLVAANQGAPPVLLIAESLIETGWYQTSEEALEEMGLPYRVYEATHLNTLAETLEKDT